MTETLESTEAIAAPTPKRPIGPIVWETILQMENDGRLITRRNLREATGLSYEQIDECIKRLEASDKVIKAGGGLIEVVPQYNAERAQSLTFMPDGHVKWEMADGAEEIFSPPEAYKHGMLFLAFARKYEDMEQSNKALIRTAELTAEVRELRRRLAAFEAAMRKPENVAQLPLLEAA